jgi:hypothetical protein
MANDEVEIQIDNKHYRSPNPTTGSALYLLGHVQPGYDLFQEVPGPGDDLLIPNSTTEIRLKDGVHFYSAKQSLNPGHDRT